MLKISVLKRKRYSSFALSDRDLGLHQILLSPLGVVPNVLKQNTPPVLGKQKYSHSSPFLWPQTLSFLFSFTWQIVVGFLILERHSVGAKPVKVASL